MKETIKKLLNWSEISRVVTKGKDRNCIRSNKTPKKYQIIIDDLNKSIKEWGERWDLW